MGKIAERLARRRSPDFEPVRQLLKLAQGDVAGDEQANELLLDYVEELLAGPGNRFESVFAQFSEEIDGRAAADELAEAVTSAAEFVADSFELSDGRSVRLLMLPFSTEGLRPAWELGFEAADAQRLQQSLVSQATVAEDCSVQMLPVALSTSAAAALSYSCVYKLARQLANGNAAQAVRQVREELGEMEAEESTTYSAPTTTLGVLMFALVSEDPDAFYLEEDVLQAFETSDSEEDMVSALTDLEQLLEVLSSEFNAGRTDVVKFFGTDFAWFNAAREAVEFERRLSAHAQLRQMTQASLDRFGDALEAEQEVSPQFEEGKLPVMTVVIRRRADGSTAGVLRWTALMHEVPEQTLGELEGFLEREMLWASSDGIESEPSSSSRRTEETQSPVGQVARHLH